VTARPEVSVLMANHNGARHIDAAIQSVLTQDLRALEVILVDDRSDDDSLERAFRLARQDRRVRVEQLGDGPVRGGAQTGLCEIARGRWAAVG